MGYVDSFRDLHPKEQKYSFFSNMEDPVVGPSRADAAPRPDRHGEDGAGDGLNEVKGQGGRGGNEIGHNSPFLGSYP